MVGLNYSKLFYQTIDLIADPANPGHFILNAPTFINKNYNLLDGFMFDFDNPGATETMFLLVDEFKIDDEEILPQGFPIDLLRASTSMPFADKFTKWTLPIRQGKLVLKLTATKAASNFNKLNITFKLKNVENIDISKIDFYKYEIHYFRADATDKFAKGSFRTYNQIKKIKGVTVRSISPVDSDNPNKNYQKGSLKMSINSKKANPINVPVYGHFSPNIKQKQEFFDLDEAIEPSSLIEFIYEEHYGTGALKSSISPTPILHQLIIKGLL